MNKKKRIMSLDVGTKTIGVAVTDELRITAQGLETYKRIGIKKDTEYVLELFKEKNCDTLVIGLPLNLDGTDSVQTEKVREFREKIENKFRSNSLADVTIDWQDERYSTVEAEEVLIAANLKRDKRKEVIDKQAAVIILQSYLDRIEHLERLKNKNKEYSEDDLINADEYFDD